MSRNLKNQATVEFLILFTLLLLGVAVATVIAYQKINEIQSQQTILDAENTLLTTAGSLDTAFIQGHGFETKAFLPDLVAGGNYNMTLYSSLLVLETRGFTISRPTLVQNFTGSLKKGENSIKNSYGMIVIS